MEEGALARKVENKHLAAATIAAMQTHIDFVFTNFNARQDKDIEESSIYEPHAEHLISGRKKK